MPSIHGPRRRRFPAPLPVDRTHLLLAARSGRDLYGGEVVFKTTDQGKNWEVVSPDLTRNDKEKQKASGGPITKATPRSKILRQIFALAESPLEMGPPDAFCFSLSLRSDPDSQPPSFTLIGGLEDHFTRRIDTPGSCGEKKMGSVHWKRCGNRRRVARGIDGHGRDIQPLLAALIESSYRRLAVVKTTSLLRGSGAM